MYALAGKADNANTDKCFRDICEKVTSVIRHHLLLINLTMDYYLISL